MNATRILEAADYAAYMHRDQRRKGSAELPYVNHVLDVAHRVSQSSHGVDEVLIIGALLHDIVEDTDGTEEDVRTRFGGDVASLVMEVTDDKTLPKLERKRLQVEKTGAKSDRAKRLKLADLASNVGSITDMPPDWSYDRKAEYLDWAKAVSAGCHGVDAALEQALETALADAHTKLGASV